MRNVNSDIKTYAKEKGIFLYEVAEQMHIADVTLSRRLRREFTISQKEEVIHIIDKLSSKLA